MAHGGHHSHSHHHSYHSYHHRSYSRSTGGYNTPDVSILISIIIVVLIIGFIGMAMHSNSISGKTALQGKYETYPSYLIDKEEYFSNTSELISGLKYLHEKTNVQMVVMTSNKSWTDSKAVEQYEKMFKDEAHILLIIPTGFFSTTEYYAIGDLVDPIIDDYEIKYLLNKIKSSKDGKKWKQSLINFTDELLSEQ